MLPKITGQPKILRHNFKSYSPPKLPCVGINCKKTDEEHTHDYLGPKGSGYLERKANGEIVYHTPWVTAAKRKPFSMPTLKARVDSDASKAFARISADVAKTRPEQVTIEKGRACAHGWELVETDGKRALIIPGDGIGDKSFSYLGDTTKGYQRTTIANPEFQLAVKRAEVMAGDRNNTVMLTCKDGTLTLASEDPDYGTFDETLSVDGNATWRTALNIDFIEPLLGTWPLTVYVKDDLSAVVFEPADKSWRYVVMPISANWPKDAVEQSCEVSK